MCAMPSLVLSAFWLLAIFVVADSSVTGQQPKPYLHDVCFDSQGYLVTSAKHHYPVTSRAPQNKKAYWEMKFKMPVSVYGVSVAGKKASGNHTFTVKLIGQSKNTKITLPATGQAKNGPIYDNVYYIRVEKSSGILQPADIKVRGVQAPAKTNCNRNVVPVARGCYSIHKVTEDYEIQYKCSRGFRLVNSFSSMSYNCSEKLKVIPQCKKLKLKCSPPPILRNSLKTVKLRQYYEQETIKYACSPDYYLTGPTVLTCRSNGIWKPPMKSTCRKIVRCPAPDELSNGEKRGVNYRHGKKLSFFCYPGYNLIGPDVVQCVNGSWSPPLNVNCKAQECPAIAIDAVANGTVHLKEVSQPGYTYGNFLMIKCNNGFILTGNNIITCRDNGSWDSNLPSCTAKKGACSDVNCGKRKECQITENGESRCVCSASLKHNCLSDILPICASNNITFWSQCQMLNYSCHHPNEHFSILRFSPCDEGQLRAVEISTQTGVEKELVYKCSFPKKIGSCRAHFHRFYFDQEQNSCLSFGWGGCNENANNFETLQECKSICSEFRACNRSQRFESALETNLALKQPTTPSNPLAVSFVDDSRVFNELQSNSTRFSSWQVSLKAPSIVTKILVWNSDKTIPWLNITVRVKNNVVASKYFNQGGRCRYEWPLRISKAVLAVGVETAQAAALHVDEVEVIGKYDRGTLVNLKEVNASARQYPETVSRNGIAASAEKAINGRLENNSAAANFTNCASTRSKIQTRHWFQIDLRKEYFITEVALWLRKGVFRRKWQKGLTAHVSNTPGNFSKEGSSLRISPQNRCGVPYKNYQEQNPVFPCYFGYATRYVVLSLDQIDYGIQLCEVQVFAATCDAPPTIENAIPHSTKTTFFAPAKVNYRCNSGYKADTSTEFSCGRTNEWVKDDQDKLLCKKGITTNNNSSLYARK